LPKRVPSKVHANFVEKVARFLIMIGAVLKPNV